MTGPGDGARLALTVLFALWILVFAYAFHAAWTAVPEGGGNARAAALRTYLGWQGVAGMIAVAVFALARRWAAGTGVRRLGRVPLAVALLHAAAVAAVLVALNAGVPL